MKSVTSAALLSILLVSPALAGTINRTIPANKTTSLGGVSLFNQTNCDPGPIPKLTLKKAPKYGRVDFKRKSVKLSKGRCKGHTMKGTVILYTPKRGFRGQDTFKYQFSYDKHVTGTLDRAYVSETFKITVK